MKHLLNNLSEQEKSSILSQHKGGIEITTKNFKKLFEHKSGSVKPLLMEQDEHTKFLEGYVANVIKDGYKQVNKISLPDGEYKKQGSGYQVDLYDRDGKTFTGYVIVTTSGIRGAWNNQPENVTNGTIGDAYKIFFKDSGYKGPSEEKPIKKIITQDIMYIPQEIIDAPPPRTNIVNGKGSFKLKNGNLYAYDFSDVTNLTQENTYFLSDTSKNNVYKIPDMVFGSAEMGDTGGINHTIWVGFAQSTQPGSTATIIYEKKTSQNYAVIQAKR
jgi:hypothetical protein